MVVRVVVRVVINHQLGPRLPYTRSPAHGGALVSDRQRSAQVKMDVELESRAVAARYSCLEKSSSGEAHLTTAGWYE